jgi:FkbM family methyltransferase
MTALHPQRLFTRVTRTIARRGGANTRAFVRNHARKWCLDEAMPSDTAYGFRMLASPRDYMSYGIYFFGEYDPRMSDLLTRFVEPGQTCWDVGAGLGWFSLLMGRRVGTTGRVDAFEALPANAARVRENISLNGFDCIRLHQQAVSDKPGTIHFQPPTPDDPDVPAPEHCSGIGYIAQAASAQTITIEASTLDDVAQRERINALHLIKMDIEGAEVAALRGGEQTLRHFKPILAIEYNRAALRRSGSSLEELDGLLESFGYERLFFRANGRCHRLNLRECADKPDELAVFNAYAFHRDDPRLPSIG